MEGAGVQWAFTFGAAYDLANHFVVVDAPDEPAAIVKFVAARSKIENPIPDVANRWAFVFPFDAERRDMFSAMGLTEVPITSPIDFRHQRQLSTSTTPPPSPKSERFSPAATGDEPLQLRQDIGVVADFDDSPDREPAHAPEPTWRARERTELGIALTGTPTRRRQRPAPSPHRPPPTRNAPSRPRPNREAASPSRASTPRSPRSRPSPTRMIMFGVVVVAGLLWWADSRRDGGPTPAEERHSVEDQMFRLGFDSGVLDCENGNQYREPSPRASDDTDMVLRLTEMARGYAAGWSECIDPTELPIDWPDGAP